MLNAKRIIKKGRLRHRAFPCLCVNNLHSPYPLLLLFSMNLYLMLLTIETAMLTKISKLLSNLRFWRILGFVSSVVAFTCFALSPSFRELFGRWNLFKVASYSVISLILITRMLFVENCGTLTRSVMEKAHVGFLVMMLTSLCSIWQDLDSQKENDKSGSRGRILNMCSLGAFGLMSLSWSIQRQLGFEVGFSNFLFGSFLVLLIKMNSILIPVAAILCYMFIYSRYFSDHQREMRVRDDSSETGLLEDIESNLAEHSTHKNRLQEHAERSHIALPIYQAENLGLADAPQFRSAVSAGGKIYISKNDFPDREASEQDVAKLALEHIRTDGVKDEGHSLTLEAPTSFKSILNDYAKKMNLELKYDTVPRQRRAGFKSSLDFNGERYSGDSAKNKKDAEQSAACAAVLSNLESILL